MSRNISELPTASCPGKEHPALWGLDKKGTLEKKGSTGNIMQAVKGLKKILQHKSHRFKAWFLGSFYVILGCLFLYKETMLQTSPRTSSTTVHKVEKEASGTRCQRSQGRFMLAEHLAPCSLLSEWRQMLANTLISNHWCVLPHSAQLQQCCLEGVLPAKAAAECFFQRVMQCKEQWEKRVLLPLKSS